MRKRGRRGIIVPLRTPIENAVLGASLIPKDILDHFRTRELASIDAFVKGFAAPEDWQAMFDMTLLGSLMADGNVGPEAKPAFERSRAVLSAIYDVFVDTGSFPVISEEQAAAFRDAYEYHDLQRQSVSRSEIEKFIRKAMAIVHGLLRKEHERSLARHVKPEGEAQ